MEQIDFKLKLVGGRPVMAEGYGLITPMSVSEIIDYGYTNYLVNLNIINVSAEDFMGSETEVDEDNKPHIIDMLISFGGDEIERQLEKSLSLFLRGEAMVDKDNLQILITSNDEIKIVNRDNYNSIKEVIQFQNYINHFEEKNLDSFNPADEATRKFKEKQEKLKKQREQLKKKSEENEGSDEDSNIDFYDIISSLSSKSFGITEIDVIDLTIYQVYSKFKRLEMIEQYEISIQSILAGAKDVKLKHWSGKIK